MDLKYQNTAYSIQKLYVNPLRTGLFMDPGRCAGIFAERPTEWIGVLNPSAGNQSFCNYVYMYMSALLCNIYA